MQSDVNSPSQRRALLRFLNVFHSFFQNLEWLTLIIFLLLPSEAFETQMEIKNIFAIFGGLVFLMGLATKLWSRGYEKKGHFVLDGPYRYVQNPDEVASVLLYAGGYLLLGVMWSWVFAFVLFCLAYFTFVSMSYEDKLKKKVGPTFPRYRQRVRRWLPSLYPAVNRTKISFHWKKAFRKEYSTWLWLAGLFAVSYARQWLVAGK